VDNHDLTMAILASLKEINNCSGEFAAGMLSDDLGEVEQVAFAHCLVDTAELIRRRATVSPIVVEGALVHDHDARLQLPPGEG
jgi:hypothetical protein